MTLPRAYPNQEAIPENMRGAYIQQGNEYVLDQLAADHPLVTSFNKKKTAETQWAGEKAALEAKAVPNGSRIIPLDDFRILEEIKKLNLPSAEITARVTEFPNLQQQVNTAKLEQSYAKAAELLKYDNPKAFIAAARNAKLNIDFQTETVDGKAIETPVVITTVDGKEVKTKWSDHLAKDIDLQLLEPAFKIKPKQETVNTDVGTGSRPTPQQQSAGSGNGATTTGAGQPQTPSFPFVSEGDVKW